MSRIIKAGQLIVSGRWVQPSCEEPELPLPADDEPLEQPPESEPAEPEPAECEPPDPMAEAERQAAELIERAEERARDLELEAEQRAADIIRQAEQRVEDIFKQATDSGYEQGWQEGLANGRQAAEELVEQAKAVLKQAEEERERVFQECRSELVDVVINATAKLLGMELSQPNAAVTIVEQALEQARGCRRCAIRVSPNDFPDLKQAEQWLWQKARLVDAMDIISDAALRPGEVFIDTDRGQIDGTIEARVEMTIDVLREVMNDADGPNG